MSGCVIIDEGVTITQTDTRNEVVGGLHTAVAYGQNTPGSYLLILVTHGDVASNPGTPSMTVSGVGATRIASDTTGSGATSDAAGAAIFVATPAAASGDIQVTWGVSNTIAIKCFRVTGYSSSAGDTETDAGVGSDGIVGMVVTDQGFVVGISANHNPGVTNLVWTNLTTRGCEGTGTGSRTWAFDMLLPANANRVISRNNWSALAGDDCMAVASFTRS